MSREKKKRFELTRFIAEAGLKLKLPCVAIATATTLYHRFGSSSSDADEYDQHLVSAACLYLASKIDESPVKVRDVVNVCYRCLHKNEPSLEVGSLFWKLRDSVVTCEFVILRTLAFQVSVDHPHTYLLHYLKVMSDWISPDVWKSVPLTSLCWSLLNDSCHTDLCLHFSGEQVAVALLYMALQSFQIDVPSQSTNKKWWKVLCSSCDMKSIEVVCTEMLDLYNLDTALERATTSRTRSA
ncbi:cyclin-Q-like [Corticium candelabrum]|uniref:cyclin-Q-like n=1 Tax=Corticium candelabrum TaxID=121492 RepID=UPI002E25F676|nr:cyclin-Q-like [Corticium candelabrum]